MAGGDNGHNTLIGAAVHSAGLAVQRAVPEHAHRVDSAEERRRSVCQHVCSTGHFEAIVKKIVRMGGHTASEYDQTLTLATLLMAVVISQAASQPITVYYGLKPKVQLYQLLDAVGVRIPGKNPRKGHATHTARPGDQHPHKGD